MHFRVSSVNRASVKQVRIQLGQQISVKEVIMADYKKFGLYAGSDRGSQIGTALTFLFIGLGIGAVSALLFAPQSGKQTRKMLRRRYEDAVDSLEDFADSATDMWEKGMDSVSDLKQKGASFASKAAERVAPVAKVLRRD